jgi:hypothetical protein
MRRATVDCGELRDMLRTGSVPTGPELSAHLEKCEHCAELLRDEGELGRALGRSEPVSDLDEASLWSDVNRAVTQESGLRAWLRSRSTTLRITIGIAAVVAITTVGASGLRADWATFPASLKVLWALLLTMAILASLPLAVVSLARGGASMARVVGLAIVGLAVPAALAFVPGASGTHSALGSFDSAFGAHVSGCLVYGLSLSVPFAVLLWALDREDYPPPYRLVMMATTAGLAGNVALFLHCSIRHPEHIVVGHAALGIVLALMSALLVRLRGAHG